MEKYGGARQATYDITCWIPRAKNSLLEYVIPQQWLHIRTSMLRCASILSIAMSVRKSSRYYFVLLTVHLIICLVINQINAQILVL